MRKFYNSWLLFLILIFLSATSCKHKGVHHSTYMKNTTYMNCDSIIAIEYIKGKPDTSIIIRDLTAEQNGEPIYEKDVFGREMISKWVYVYYTDSGKGVKVITWNPGFTRYLDSDGIYVSIDNDGEITSPPDERAEVGHLYIGKQRAFSSLYDALYYDVSYRGPYSNSTPIGKYISSCYVHIRGERLCPLDTIVLYENGIVDTAALIENINLIDNISGKFGDGGGGVFV